MLFNIRRSNDKDLRTQISDALNSMFALVISGYSNRLFEAVNPAQWEEIRDSIGQEFGWRDIIGVPQEPVKGGGKPTWTKIASSGVYTWNYATNDTQYYSYHMPHDYVPGTDIYFHVHWFSGTTAGASTRWQFDFLYASGHQQEPFPTTSTTVYCQQVQSTTPYMHMITETNGVTIPALETDGLILLKVKRIAPTGGPSDVAGGVFVPVVDIHYQSHNLATKNKAPNFYT